jgi:hypothetical protein
MMTSKLIYNAVRSPSIRETEHEFTNTHELRCISLPRFLNLFKGALQILLIIINSDVNLLLLHMRDGASSGV